MSVPPDETSYEAGRETGGPAVRTPAQAETPVRGESPVQAETPAPAEAPAQADAPAPDEAPVQAEAGIPTPRLPLPDLRDTIARHGLVTRKSLGQHFLLDANICARIAAIAGPMEGRQVLEVGPGPGGLTRALLATAAARVVAVELDRRAVSALAELAEANPGRLDIVQGDALKARTEDLLPTGPRRVVSNLPYNVGTPLLVGWIKQAALFESLTLMFQQEVAERICAAPDSDAYGRLSVLAQWRCACRMAMRLPPGAFTPPPKVWSAVVQLVPHAEAPAPDLLAAMERLTAAAFGQRRKMLRSSLKTLGDSGALLEQGEILATRRAETLSVAEFDRLARLLAARDDVPLR